MRLDAERNEVVVGPRDFLRTQSLVLKNINWLGDEPLAAAASRRIAHPRARCAPRSLRSPPRSMRERTEPRGSCCSDGENGVAAGQACVFYADGATEARVLGGGLIARTLAPAMAGAESGLGAGVSRNAADASTGGAQIAGWLEPREQRSEYPHEIDVAYRVPASAGAAGARARAHRRHRPHRRRAP